MDIIEELSIRKTKSLNHALTNCTDLTNFLKAIIRNMSISHFVSKVFEVKFGQPTIPCNFGEFVKGFSQRNQKSEAVPYFSRREGTLRGGGGGVRGGAFSNLKSRRRAICEFLILVGHAAAEVQLLRAAGGQENHLLRNRA